MPGTTFPESKIMEGQLIRSMIGSACRTSASNASRSAGLHSPCFIPAVQSKVIPSSFRLALARSNSSSVHFSYSPTSSTFVYPAAATFSRRCSNGMSRNTVQSMTDNLKGARDDSRLRAVCELSSAKAALVTAEADSKVPATLRANVRRFISHLGVRRTHLPLSGISVRRRRWLHHFRLGLPVHLAVQLFHLIFCLLDFFVQPHFSLGVVWQFESAVNQRQPVMRFAIERISRDRLTQIFHRFLRLLLCKEHARQTQLRVHVSWIQPIDLGVVIEGLLKV